MERIRNENGSRMVIKLADTISENKDFLSEIDGAAGDGDHGINMDKGFRLAVSRLEDSMTVDRAFRELGFTLVNDIGGSMGPIYGSFFMSIAKTIKGNEWIDKELFLRALEKAVQSISELAGAQQGDKTLLDTLIPGLDAYREKIRKQESFVEALKAMEKAAYEGMQSTKDMIAKVGRASRLGGRSRGYIDAGAASCYFILKSIAEIWSILL